MLNVVINMFPPVFRLHPDYSVRLNNALKAQPLGNRSWLTGQPQGQLFQAQMKDIGVEIKIANTDSTKLFAISSSQDTYRTGGGSNYGQSASK